VKPVPVRSIRPRPPSARRLVRTRTEAAAELIRLEHERDRLTQALASLEPRRENARERLKQIDERARQLLGFLEITKADDVANGDVVRPPR
jgi:cell shape-determining protein MreC